MAWIIGIDEAGYGPNLGPFVMTLIGCRIPDDQLPSVGGLDLWAPLAATVRRGGGRDKRLIIDDSKVVHSGPKGLLRLEQGVLAALAPDLAATPTLSCLLAHTCKPDATDHTDLAEEVWFTGTTPVPGLHSLEDHDQLRDRFATTCRDAQLGPWQAHSVIICPARFNALTRAAGSKAAVSAYALARLLLAGLDGMNDGPIAVFIDKQGGRNCYGALIQQGLPRGMVRMIEETLPISRYDVVGFGTPLRFTFEPRADSSHFCVALASMTSKYLRECLMAEFNAFWLRHLPDLRPTAGYPVDAARFFAEVRPVAQQLNIPDDVLWRER
jgi:hypothetical protein